MDHFRSNEIEVAKNHGLGIHTRQANGKPIFGLTKVRIGLKQITNQQKI
jgi:hypothetical protein